MINKMILIGHVGADPKVTDLQSGGKMVTFSLATSERWRDKTTGERKERTQWFRVVIFGEGLTKIAEQYVHKGSKLYVEGPMKSREYTDKDGVKRETFEVVLQGFNCVLQMLDKMASDRAPEPNEDSYGEQRDFGGGQSRTGPAESKRDDMDDEIPF